MNIVNKLTLRTLLKNKRRTLVTIIGVIISVAMITGVSTLATSIIKSLQVQHVQSYGDWHISYEGLTKEQVKGIKEDKHTKDIFLRKDLGFSQFETIETPFKPYLFFTEFDELAFEKMPIEVIEGRLPKAANEVIIQEKIVTEAGLNLKIGDSFSAAIGDRRTSDEDYSDYFLDQYFSLRVRDGESTESIDVRLEKEYTVVGIMKQPTWEHFRAPGYTVIAGLSEEEGASASVLWKKINRKTLREAKDLGNSLGIEEVIVNKDYLVYFGIIKSNHLRTSLYMNVLIVLLIIMVGSVALIYNAFAISVSERSRHLGMLSSVGATKLQKRNSVFFEGLVIGAVSIPLGLLGGIAGIAVTLSFVNSIFKNMIGMEEELVFFVQPMTIVLAVLVSLLTIFISTYIPARRASKVSAIDAIRQSEDIKLTAKQVKTSKLVRRFFGFEAEIGLKNLKRNKRRYVATVFSLVISIVLFLSVNFFVEQIKKSLDAYADDRKYDLKVNQTSLDIPINEDFVSHISLLEEVEEMMLIQRSYMGSYLAREKLHQQLIYDDGLDKNYVSVELISLDDKSFVKFLEEVGVSLEGWTDFTALLINQSRTSGEKLGFIEPLLVELGDELPLHFLDWNTDEEVDSGVFTIGGITDQHPFGIEIADAGTVQILVSEKQIKNLREEYPVNFTTEIAILSNDVLAAHDRIEALNRFNFYIDNPLKMKQENRGVILIIQIFTYGFICLITLISIANIFNTISTSVALRKREFAMLKSVGMTPKGFRKMIHYESLFYGIKALLYGLPLSIGIMYLEYRALVDAFEYAFSLPWGAIFIVVVGVFLIVGMSMAYSSAKVKKENIIDALKQENI